ncbi:hypothetical protein AB2S31_13830 [Elizabethkingia anophelis]|uniref:hypothetical protein n=1 Tax=Elizabethkingia anophelis TaxID=1117645 RepID=UPI003462F4E1
MENKTPETEIIVANNDVQPKITQVIIVQNQKSVGLAFILTFFFGPLGMLYSTVAGGIIMFILSIIIAIVTFGFGLFIKWPVCIIWGTLAASQSNAQIQRINTRS